MAFLTATRRSPWALQTTSSTRKIATKSINPWTLSRAITERSHIRPLASNYYYLTGKSNQNRSYYDLTTSKEGQNIDLYSRSYSKQLRFRHDLCPTKLYTFTNVTISLRQSLAPALPITSTSLSFNSLPHNRIQRKSLHISPNLCASLDEEESIVEKSVKSLKERKIAVSKTAVVGGVSETGHIDTNTKDMVTKPSLLERIKSEVLHYYNGFRLLAIDIKVASRLLWKSLNGNSLSRRERKQFTRTVSDIFRLLPFSIFIIVPFMEVLLPVAIKLFPNMLPSTFEDKEKRDEKRRKQLNVKLEMAKFLQDTIEEMAVSKKIQSKDSAQSLVTFFQDIRSSGTQASNEDIIKYSKFFKNELTLDSMSRLQLVALCRLLLITPYGTDNLLRFQLRLKLRQLKSDDMLIRKEGIDSLNAAELQSACQARGMRAIGVSVQRLKSQLSQWLELHLEKEIPTSLLLLSRALYLPEHLSASDALKATLSKLPESMVDKAGVEVAEVEGDLIDHGRKLEVIKHEEELIAKEEDEKKKEEEEKMKEKETLSTATDDSSQEVVQKEVLKDTIPSVKISTKEEDKISKEELIEVSKAISELSETSPLSTEKELLQELKEDREEYKEDVDELVDLGKDDQVEESISSKRLGRRLDRIITDIQGKISKLEEKSKQKSNRSLFARLRGDVRGDGIVTTQELVMAIMASKDKPDYDKIKKIAEIFDENHDGSVEISDIRKTIEVISEEGVDLKADQITNIVRLLKEAEVANKESESSEAV
ncbi:uncharacterized protein TRIADDRAFT_60795 [Trichoplax adhaerens]|uniref:Mitochondrial proton/calcium exchanger protein n=1 Tax=Trichoplax adhaerens TaxID=10228 RepID=B3S8Z2_TRIAD|nr:hypothetical protein TRIADDRAFT_60795 [Trichoplax adhaerens]EDV20787.1 hypothetical protein TRIADDRAFT_60795 [Trichoplax adhaerens]|eukprot:XP_002116728.1 hypothetical protein TRIADDRAFT_60795 [Trichoplax adhaerens]